MFEKNYTTSVLEVLAIVVFCIFFNHYIIEDREKDTYPLVTVVTTVDYKTNEVICMDYNGHLWSFKDCEDWQVGDYCSMIIDTNRTADIYDDTILTTKYNGRLEGKFGIGHDGKYLFEITEH